MGEHGLLSREQEQDKKKKKKKKKKMKKKKKEAVMSKFGIFLKLALLCSFLSRGDSEHFLIETGDDNSEAEGLGDLPEVNGESLNRMGLNRQADGSGEFMENGQDGCISGQQPPKEKRKPGCVYINWCKDGWQHYANYDVKPNGKPTNQRVVQVLLNDTSPGGQDLRKEIFD